MTTANGKRNKRKDKAMSDVELPANVPDASREDYERGMAVLVNTKRERDEAIAAKHEALVLCDVLRKELGVREAQLEALKNFSVFESEQYKIKSAQADNVILTYRSERDAAVREKAELEACLNMLERTVLNMRQERGNPTQPTPMLPLSSASVHRDFDLFEGHGG